MWQATVSCSSISVDAARLHGRGMNRRQGGPPHAKAHWGIFFPNASGPNPKTHFGSPVRLLTSALPLEQTNGGPLRVACRASKPHCPTQPAYPHSPGRFPIGSSDVAPGLDHRVRAVGGGRELHAAGGSSVGDPGAAAPAWQGRVLASCADFGDQIYDIFGRLRSELDCLNRFSDHSE